MPSPSCTRRCNISKAVTLVDKLQTRDEQRLNKLAVMSAGDAGGWANPLRRPTTPLPNKRLIPQVGRPSSASASLCTLQGPAHLLGPISPAEIDAGACGGQKVDLACNGEQGDPVRWGPHSINRPVGLSEVRLSAQACAMENAHRSVQSPSHSLRSCSGPAGPLLASLKSVAAVFRFRSGDQRLISCRAGR
jgi:hypothetical protein